MTSVKGSNKHTHAEVYSGEKVPDSEGWTYYFCATCPYRWRTKTISEDVTGQPVTGSEDTYTDLFENTPTPAPKEQLDEIIRTTIYMGTSTNTNSMNRCRRKAKAAITDLITRAKIEELQWGMSHFSPLDKSHVGRSFYNRNTAFKNYAVKFWNNRVGVKRDKFKDRIKQLRTLLGEEEK